MPEIVTTAADGILTLTIARPDKRNALTADMYSALADGLDAALDDAGVRVVVIEGDDDVFSAGNDVQDFLDDPPTEADSPVVRFLRTIARFPKPLVAAVCGPAVGVGTTMLLHCDLVYAGDNAVFLLPFVDLGLPPEAGSSLLLPQLVGSHRAAAMLLLGEPVGAQEALASGLVNRVVPAAEARAVAHQAARSLAAKPLAALLESKRLLRDDQAPAVMARIEAEVLVFGRMLREPAAREAFSAFIEKRRPDFSGM